MQEIGDWGLRADFLEVMLSLMNENGVWGCPPRIHFSCSYLRLPVSQIVLPEHFFAMTY